MRDGKYHPSMGPETLFYREQNTKANLTHTITREVRPMLEVPIHKNLRSLLF